VKEYGRTFSAIIVIIPLWHTPQVDSAFYPPWDGKNEYQQRAVMFCGWGVKTGMV